ncbi:MAG TPA: hypothetical protein VGJ05_14250 [Fimbriiglobus sp.]|jgi:hypothetical protein
MPHFKKAIPAYSLHKPSGRAYVRLPDGVQGRKTVYLGSYGSAESRAASGQLIADSTQTRD